jgi:uncharacterized protein YlxW (UPF0749 family)
MLVLGLLLILGSAALGAGLVYDGSEAAKVEILGTTVDTTMAGVFFSGAATMLVFLVGVWLLQSKMGRSRRKRIERKEARRRQRESVAKLEQERVQLAAENERLAEKLGTREDTADDERQDTTIDARHSTSVDTRQDTSSTTT